MILYSTYIYIYIIYNAISNTHLTTIAMIIMIIIVKSITATIVIVTEIVIFTVLVESIERR